MNHAKVENSQIVRVGIRPVWYLDGEIAPDYVYRAGGVETDEEGVALRHPDGTYVLATGKPGWFPIVYEEPEYDPRWQYAVQNARSEWRIEETRVVATYTVHDIPLEDVIATARQEAYGRINGEYERRTQVLAAGYPAAEQQSWPVQIREADIVLSDDDEPTPWIDAAAPARGITREQLATLIKAQDTAYRQYHGALTGTRQALRDQIAAVPDDDPESVQALYSIEWPEEPETETT